MENSKKISFKQKIARLYREVDNVYRQTKDPRLLMDKWLLVISVYAEKAALMIYVPAVVLMLITRQPFFAMIANWTIAVWGVARASLFMASYWLPRYLNKLKSMEKNK